MLSVQYAQYDRQVSNWLMFCAAVIFGMIVLGGVTRLTDSGLSMVEWKPLMGVIPPLSQEAWQETFEKYRLYPEYQKINKGMSLDAFKSIFMYEYLHRVLGRVIGVIFFFPMVYFALKGRVKSGIMPKLWVLFLMGGAQGLMGWYMVKSGLVDRPDVSQYRLTAHLGLAMLIYSLMVWLVLDLRQPKRGLAGGRFARFSTIVLGLVFLMILSGGLVAGTDAGFAYSTWPLMGESFVPEGLYSGSPAWLAMFEDVTTIQFNHRMFAYALSVLMVVFAIQVLRAGVEARGRVAIILLLLALALQVVLGISTLLLHVPIALAAGHQAGAVLLLTAAVYATHALQSRRAK
ncbi:MAG: cytochrome c oxidase assembly protein subunit 15 [Halieaceae bacterium]|jgi:cytochrome c oxidase assembly protein subunit 15